MHCALSVNYKHRTHIHVLMMPCRQVDWGETFPFTQSNKYPFPDEEGGRLGAGGVVLAALPSLFCFMSLTCGFTDTFPTSGEYRVAEALVRRTSERVGRDW